MASEARNTTWQRRLIALSWTVIFVVVLTALRWGGPILIPLALAIFLTFVLSPLATLLERRGLGQVPSVIIVVALTVLVLSFVSWVVVHQVSNLLDELPKHTNTIKKKIETVRGMIQQSGDSRLAQMFDELSAHVQAPEPSAANKPDRNDVAKEAARAVIVQQSQPAWLYWLGTALGEVVEFLTLTALAVVLFVFMLAKRADLRNRFIRLAGLDRMTLTTRAVDDAAQRISRFLVTQALINASYGLCITLGLFLLGVPNAILWGFISGLLRYAPYVGAPLAAVFPITLSLALSPGWTQPILVVVLVVVLEALFGNLIEPLLFGHSMGVSGVAQLTAAAFWAYLWGPIGLVLSGPLTVCLLVLGKYVPQLEFLEVLLGDEPPLTPAVSYFQRLLARDQDEAAEIVQNQLKDQPVEKVFEEVLMPALAHARQDLARGQLSDTDQQFIVQATREVLEEATESQATTREEPSCPLDSRCSEALVRILACPARDDVDRLVLEMVQHVLNPGKWYVQLMEPGILVAELLAKVEQLRPGLVCIGTLLPGGLARTRYLCKRLRTQFPDLRILVGLWGNRNQLDEARKLLNAAGADHVEGSLEGIRQQLRAWFSVLSQEPPTPSAGPAGQASASLQSV